MKNKILKLLSEHIPADLSVKSIASVNPQLRSFFSAAAAAGYGAAEIQKYLQQLTNQAPGRQVRQEELGRRREKGQLRQSDILEQENLQKQEREVPRISPGLIAGAAGLASSGLMGAGGRDQVEEVSEVSEVSDIAEPEDKRTQTFFERAMEGVSFFDLDDKVKPNVGKLGKRLDVLEKQGVPWKDRAVQNVVRALKKFSGGAGIIDKELSRFDQPQQQTQQKGQAGGTDAEFMAILDEFSSRFLG